MFLFGRKSKGKKNVRERHNGFRWKYENLRQLLQLNNELLETLAEIQSYSGSKIPDDEYTSFQISSLVDGIAQMIECLNHLAGQRYGALYRTHAKIAGGLQEILFSGKEGAESSILLPLEKAERNIVNIVGGKAAVLGELKRIFPQNVPDGFIIATSAYHNLLNENNLNGQIRALFSKVDIGNQVETEYICSQIRRFVENSLIPISLSDAIEKHLQSAIKDDKGRWAVRSSAVGEDGTFSFAGQFDSILNVRSDRLGPAYLKVVSSRFKPNAVVYRLSNDIKEAECPMATIFLKMVDARSSGVLYTRNRTEGDDDRMVISAVFGLAADLLSGSVEADTFLVDRRAKSISEQSIGNKETKLVLADAEGLQCDVVPLPDQSRPALSHDEISELVEFARQIEDYYGRPMDIEWAIDHRDKVWILQARPLQIHSEKQHDFEISAGTKCKLLAEGGVTIFPGRAQGRLHICDSPEELSTVKTGEILLIKKAEPEIVSVFPRISGLITEYGHPTSHAATMVHEYGIPGLFNLKDARKKLADSFEIGLDATRRKIYAGLPWPNMPQRVVAGSTAGAKATTAIEKLLFQLNLIDPGAANFTPLGCISMHDIIRFVHEKAVIELFEVGDSQVEVSHEGFKILDTEVPLNLTVFHIGNVLDKSLAGKKKIRPEDVRSEPFQALWRGISGPEIRWTGRTNVNFGGLASVLATSVTQDGGPARNLGDRNYLIIGPDYINLNARLAYHYSMVDAMVSESAFGNYVGFRFRGGGAGRTRRGLRAKFIAGVLSFEGFSVDRRGDLVTAWYRGYDKNSSNARLEMLGRLMGCARQLDMLFDTRDKVEYYVKQFMDANYGVFE
jgi:pyruvate, water dikinase